MKVPKHKRVKYNFQERLKRDLFCGYHLAIAKLVLPLRSLT